MEENALLEIMKCYACKAYLIPPIWLCQTGHSVCDECYKTLSVCSICERKFTGGRNLLAEAYSPKLLYPCKNSKSGCQETLTVDKVKEHQANCSYQSYKCGVKQCNWHGTIDQIENHFTNAVHINYETTNDKSSLHFHSGEIQSFVNLIKLFDHLFWFKYYRNEEHIFWAVQYIGAENEADQYSYEVEIKNYNEELKIKLRKYCHKIGIGDSELFKIGNCINVSRKIFERYVGPFNRTYNFQLKIRKNTEEENNNKKILA